MKTAKNMGTHVFMQASVCVINYLNVNKVFVALSTICDTVFAHYQVKTLFSFGRKKFFRL